MSRVPLKPLHEQYSPAKLAAFRRLATDDLIATLCSGQPNALKARPDGTIVEGNHRIHVLRERGVDVDALPREIHERTDDVD